jgi:hypothetical protein
VGLAEYEGAITNPDGLDLEAVVAHRRETGAITDFPHAMNLARLDALELPCDVLIPAALENQLREDNAPRINTRIVLEGANGPTTPEAEAILNAKGVMVVPDIYANAGGVTVSYFEWLKNLSHVRFGRMENRYREASQLRMFAAIERATGKTFTDLDRQSVVKGADELTLVNSGLEETMIAAYREIKAVRVKHPTIPDLRTAAFLVAIEKVGRSYLELGIFPSVVLPQRHRDLSHREARRPQRIFFGCHRDTERVGGIVSCQTEGLRAGTRRQLRGGSTTCHAKIGEADIARSVSMDLSRYRSAPHSISSTRSHPDSALSVPPWQNPKPSVVSVPLWQRSQRLGG